MIELLMLAAAQVQAVRLPPVIVPPPAPVTGPVTAPVDTQAVPRIIPRTATQAEPGLKPIAPALPDLVVKAINIEDGRMYVQVANEGGGDAKGFTVKGDATVGLRSASTMFGSPSPGLAAGATQWVQVTGFGVSGEPAYPPPPPFELSKATAVAARVDPPPGLLERLGNDTPSLPGQKATPKCTPEYGCIKEMNEENNELKVTGDAIGRSKPG